MFCPECGAPNEEDSVYCGNCGAPMNSDDLPTLEGDETILVEPAEELDVIVSEEAPEGLEEDFEKEALPQDELSVVPARPTPPPPPPLPPVYHTASVQTSGLAIASLVMGIAGWTLFPLLGSILAIIFGYAARREIRLRPDELTGEGMAIAGLVLGWLMVGLSVLGLCLGAIALCLLPVIFTSSIGY